MTFKGKIPWNKGKPWSKEIKDKISESHKGKPKPWNSYHRSEDTRKKISEARKGKPAPWNSYPRSEEYRRNMSKAMKGKRKSKKHGSKT
jgi:hypothetical protein